jgi:hypothetical protein
VTLHPQMWALRRKQNSELRLLLNKFIRQHPDIDSELDNWTPEEDRAWREFRADFNARCKVERHSLAVELGLLPDDTPR